MPEGSPLNRRTFLSGASVAAAALAVGSGGRVAADTPPAAMSTASPTSAADGVDLHWLDGLPTATTGTAWGVPWSRGQVAAGTAFALQDSGGGQVPVQSWPLAHWPDGTLKWTGHAVSSTAMADGFHLAPGTPAAPEQPVTAKPSGEEIRPANGVVDIRIACGGPVVIRSIALRGRRDPPGRLQHQRPRATQPGDHHAAGRRPAPGSVRAGRRRPAAGGRALREYLVKHPLSNYP